MPSQFETALANAAAAIEARLGDQLSRLPEGRLKAAMQYATLGSAKRLRPFLVLESARLHGIGRTRALGVAAALEMIHCYSLVHDDLPAMDNDDLRRGKLTTHRSFDEATAILTGDALLSLAFEVMASAGETPALIAALAAAAGPQGMVGGQMLDIEAETRNFSSLAEISTMQQAKTGALFEFACTAGPLMAGSDTAPLRKFARCIGLAFQIADDILDVESNAATLGKATAKDNARGKATFVDFLGLDGAKAEAARLVSEAKAALAPYGVGAQTLYAAADYITARRK